MYSFYTPILVLQAICLYHAYRHSAEQRRYWFIVILPLVGCALYLYHNFYSRSSLNSIKEGVKTVVISNYRIEQLEKALKLSDNVTNRSNLADAFMNSGACDKAVELYEQCVVGFMADDGPMQMKLLQAYFHNKNYDLAVALGDKLNEQKKITDENCRITYAWALHQNHRSEDAKSVFESMNKSYGYYDARLAYCNFLINTEKLSDMRIVLSDILQEFELMGSNERKFYKHVLAEARNLNSQHQTA